MGMFVGLGIMFVTGWAVYGLFQLVVLRGRLASPTEGKIFCVIVVGIWYILWFHGPNSWFFDDGDLDLAGIFATTVMGGMEIASGTEYLFNLEPGTLGGYDWVER
jgi:hypothetical protein